MADGSEGNSNKDGLLSPTTFSFYPDLSRNELRVRGDIYQHALSLRYV